MQLTSNLRDTRKFWENYYAGIIAGDSALVEEPSPYARTIISEISANSTLLEVGCGNGRDSCYFASYGLAVIATDVCENAIKITSRKLPSTSRALVASTTGLPDIVVDYAYARFVLHALTEEEQDAMFKWLKLHVRRKVFIETRSLKDPRCGKGKQVGRHAYIDTHYRRFMSCEELIAAATRAGFKECQVEETVPGSGNDGACVIRATLAL